MDSDMVATRAKLMIDGHSLSTTISVPTFSCLVCLTSLSFKEGGC